MATINSQKKAPFTDEAAMGLAILEGHKGAGWTSPNPHVGCVILDEDHLLLSAAYHKKYGGPHAEIEALKGVSEEQLEGAHLFVTLEPCAHQGKTPSCAERLAKLPFASITYGLLDPNPLVSGKGIEILRKAGKVVKAATSHLEELDSLAEIFFHNMRFHKPFVAMKVASSMDGQMGLKNGESKWITNEKSRSYAHYLRGVYDAILVGKRTVAMDNPSLNIRHPDFTAGINQKTNKVVVMDPQGDLIPDLMVLNVAKNHDPQHLYVVVDERLAPTFAQHTAFTLVPAPFDKIRGFDLEFLLKDLYKRGIYSILLEGGSFLYQTFLRAGQIQRLYHFQAPILIGAEHGLSWTAGFGISSMAKKIELSRVQTHHFDNDILVTGRIQL
jgi:diaminohydroxyphosphoribosylaminopyrimidine deaminase/5-amino-6-(5-phosphoribosylamino)uracil reductase